MSVTRAAWVMSRNCARHGSRRPPTRRIIGRVRTRPLIAREDELARIERFIAGDPHVLLIRGVAGIGKTVLWQESVRRARERGWAVLVAAPASAEARLSFAALGDLLAPVASAVLPALAAPQRAALEVALSLAAPEGRRPDGTAVARAALGALRAAAEARPVLVAIDDVQWLDAPSALTVAFALRRLRDKRIHVVLSQRTASAGDPFPIGLERPAPAGDPERDSGAIEVVELGPLSLGAIAHLIRERAGLALPRPVVRRIHETAHGNPLLALELAGALRRHGATLRPGAPLPVPAAYEELVRERVAILPVATRRALVELAALTQPDAALLDVDALGPAFANGLIEREGDRVRFTHPLLGAAVYAQARRSEARDAHLRLAPRVPTLEQRARHLALAAEGPDDAVASELDAAAADALARGAPSGAAEILERAFELTPVDDADARARRAAEAADAYYRSGDAPRAFAVAERAIAALPSGAARAGVLCWLADARHSIELADRALAEGGLDERIRARAFVARSEARLIADDLRGALDDARAALTAATAAGDEATRSRAMNHVGFLGAMAGLDESVALLARAAEEEPSRPPSLVYGPTTALGVVRLWRDELDEARIILEGRMAIAAERGDEHARAQLAERLARVEIRSGAWERALEWIDESTAIREGAGMPTARVTLALRSVVEASRGELADATANAERCLAELRTVDPQGIHEQAVYALGFAHLQAGRYADAAEELGALSAALERAGVGEPGIVGHHADELEALVLAGHAERARERIAEVERRGRERDRPREIVAALRARALLDGSVADAEAALAECARLPIPLERARTLLVLGTLQRRAKRWGEARRRLGEAIAELDRLGARALAERARSELARVGGRTAAGALTETERRVAELAARGRTNKEIAAEVFLSIRGVEANLSRVYEKLGVRSRAELAHRLTR